MNQVSVKFTLIVSVGILLVALGSRCFANEKPTIHRQLSQEILIGKYSTTNRESLTTGNGTTCVFSECKKNQTLSSQVSDLLKSELVDLSDSDLLLLRKLSIAASVSNFEDVALYQQEFVELYLRLHQFDDKHQVKEVEHLGKALHPYMLKCGVEEEQYFYHSEFYKKFIRRVNYLNRKQT